MALKKNVNKCERETQPESKKLLRGLYEQKIKGTLCDIQLRLQDSFIWGHACVLASCSSYFMDHFLPNEAKEETHWCTKKPLVIELDKVMGDIKELCLICVSKIIDFMYLRELIVIKGHFQHFSRIAHFLKVHDLLPLCERYFVNETSLLPIKTNVEVNGKLSMPSSNDNINKVIHTSKIQTNQLKVGKIYNKSESLPENLQSLSDNVLKSVKSDCSTGQCTSVLEKNRTEETKFSELHENLKDIQLQPSESSKIDTEQKQRCEFICCNNNYETFSSESKKRKRRRLACEICPFLTTSIKKMLKHIESNNHFGTVCPICTRRTQTSNDLKQHVKDHLNSKPFICHICKKRNRHWEYHKLHFKVHCRKKMFYCDICQKGFKRHENLSTHQLTHDKRYSCNKCGYLTSESKAFKLHLFQHGEKTDGNQCELDCNDDYSCEIDAECKKHIIKEFHCQICDQGFTQKKNLTRHTQLKHLSVIQYNCSKCAYVSNRTDLLRHHMKKHHNCIPDKTEEKLWKSKNVKFRKKVSNETFKSKNSVVGVLIPVKLVSTNDSSVLNAFAVKSTPNEWLQPGENIHNNSSFESNNGSNNNTITNTVGNESSQLPQIKTTDQNARSTNMTSKESLQKTPVESNSQIDLYTEKITNLLTISSNNEHGLAVPTNGQEAACETNVKIDLCVDVPHFENSEEVIEPHRQNIYKDIKQSKESNIIENVDQLKDESNFLERNENIWLNEATGELLSGNNFVNVHLIDTSCRVEHGHMTSSVTGKSSLPFGDTFQTIILNETGNGLSVCDLGDDTEDFHSNPQTPQASLVELEDPDNLFSWNCLNNTFCSTWVLNETTGELNMVSFDIQPFNNSNEFKLDKEAEQISRIDDDETALFLNEGTGDLSVIYFNPNKNDCGNLKQSINEQFYQEALETLSEHSNDEDDLLSEEFLMASASFMAQEGNETFLNELTGEFSISNLNNYQPRSQESHIIGNESVYLNEETGEISWNTFDKNPNNDLFTSSDILSRDYDDSLNCEDFEPFATEFNDFSSQFCLDANTSNEWNTIDDTCDILLNERTGELVKRS